MKITPKQYAQSLYEAVSNKQAPQIRVVIKNFINLLAANNDLVKADKIVESFIKIWNLENSVVVANVTTARQVGVDVIKILYKYIKQISGAKQLELGQSIDKNILGGVVIRYGDKVLDGSLKTRLGELRDKMIK